MKIGIGIGLSALRALSNSAEHDGFFADFRSGFFYTKVTGENALRYNTAQEWLSWSSSSKFVRKQSGLFAPSGANTPAVESDVVMGDCGVRIEGAATNAFIQTTALDGASWTKQNLTVAPGFLAITGDNTAFRLTDTIDGSALQHSIYPAASLSASDGLTYTIDAIVKWVSGAARSFRIGFPSTFPGSPVAYWNPITGALLGTAGGPVSTSAVDLGGGWWHFSISALKAVTNSSNFYVIGLSNGTARDYQGDGSSQCLVVFPKFAASPIASSPIPTAGAAVTRNADAISVALGSWWNPLAGTVLIEAARLPQAATGTYASFDDGSATEAIWMGFGASDQNVQVRDAGNNQTVTLSGGASRQFYRAAASFQAGALDFCVNGGLAAVNASMSMPVCTTLRLGARNAGLDPMFGNIRKIEYWPRKLTRGELEAVTQ